ncbi:hypothetical protein NL676_017652 [Syzygium grande]|nr:hypothetical protein NL676_017652 [Syzygium grande]
MVQCGVIQALQVPGVFSAIISVKVSVVSPAIFALLPLLLRSNGSTETGSVSPSTTLCRDTPCRDGCLGCRPRNGAFIAINDRDQPDFVVDTARNEMPKDMSVFISDFRREHHLSVGNLFSAIP